jgi:hypothetical protein
MGEAGLGKEGGRAGHGKEGGALEGGRGSTDLLPYILHMEMVCARLISMSSERLCFQCRMSVSFSASISSWADLPWTAPCWTSDWMPREAKYWRRESS